MGLSLRSNVQTPQAGQKITISVEDTLNPAHYMFIGGMPASTGRGFSIPGNFSDTDNPLELFETSQTYIHHMTHAAVLDGAGGTFEYTINNSWQNHLREGAQMSIVLKNFAGTEAVRIMFYEYSDHPSIKISTHLGLQLEHHNFLIAHWPAGTIVRVEYKTDIKVFLNNALIYQGAQNFSIGWPLKLTYEYLPETGSQADIGGLSGSVTFSEIKLTGGWYPYLDPIHQLTGVWSLIFHDASHNQVGGPIPFTPHWEPGGAHYIDFDVPAIPAGATHIRVRHWIQDGRAHGFTETEYPLASGSTEPPLAISGPNPIVLEPGESFDVQVTGYTPLSLSYEVIEVGGGSFGSGLTANRYTAPTAAGTYTIRVTQGTRQVTKSVFVKPRLFIGGVPISTVAMIGGTAKTITTNFNVPSPPTTGWVSSGPTLSSKTATSVVATAPNSTASYAITAKTGLAAPWDEVTLGVNVTSTGSIPTGGLKLLPAEGITGAVNQSHTISLTAETDATVVVWATVQNLRIDGSNNNLVLQQNIGEANARLANCFNNNGGTLLWQFNPSNVPDSIDIDHAYRWFVEDRQGSILAYFSIEYTGSGTNYIPILKDQNGSVVNTGSAFAATATTQMRITSTDGVNFTFEYRADNGSSWSALATNLSLSGVQARFQYSPSIRSRLDNTVIIAKPTLSSGWGRWVRPNWFAEILDTAGNVIGTYPTVASESSLIVSGNRAQQLLVTLSAASTGRVRALYPSGAAPVNNVAITVAPSSGDAPLAWQAPAAGDFPLSVNPGQEITLTTNFTSVTAFTEINGKGTFGTGANRNKWTAPALAGTYTIRATKGGETLTGVIKVLPKLTPASSSVQASGGGNNRSTSFLLNTNEGEIQVGVSAGGTVQLIRNTDGTSTVAFFSGTSAGGPFVVTATTQFGNATAQVTVTSATVPPIAISSPATNTVVDPTSSTPYVDIVTNYPGTTTFSATGGAFGTGAQANRWFAPQTAGTYVITATGPTGSGGPVAINLKVPLKISPATLLPLSPNSSVQLAANISPIIEWRLSGDGQWGTINSLSPTTTLTVKDIDGAYTVTLRALVAGVEQNVVLPVTVIGTPLELAGGLQVTVEPVITGTSFSGSTYRVLTNKTLADSNLTFTCESGNGGFGTGADKNLYTAPADAGNYQFFVQYLNQKKTVAVRVPARIAPANASVATSGSQNFATNSNITTPSTQWTATGGTLSSKATRGATYTAGVVAGTYAVTAVTVEGTVVAEAKVTLTGPALTVSSGLAITLASKATHQIVANYGPSDGVTFVATTPNIDVSATGLVTGPALAGVYTIEVRKTGHTTQVVTITVPLTISPNAQTVLPNQQIRFSVNYPTVAWSASAGAGTINALTGDFIAAATPGGPFTITASTSVGSVSATINITPTELIISGPDTITLEPGATHEVKANFPNAMLIFNALSGGSFGSGPMANVYTAPAQAGTYKFQVTVQNGSATKEITVIVPLRITPSTVQMSPGGSRQFSVNAPQGQWSVTSDYPGIVGTISGTGFYQSHADAPPIVKVTVSANNASDTATVSFLTDYPYAASYPISSSLDRQVALTITEDGTRWGTALGEPKRAFELKFLNRERAEYLAARQHWRDYYPDKAFIFHNLDTGESIPVQYDSRMTEEWQGPGEVDYAFRIIEV
jgi:hypothetical protein